MDLLLFSHCIHEQISFVKVARHIGVALVVFPQGAGIFNRVRIVCGFRDGVDAAAR